MSKLNYNPCKDSFPCQGLSLVFLPPPVDCFMIISTAFYGAQHKKQKEKCWGSTSPICNVSILHLLKTNQNPA